MSALTHDESAELLPLLAQAIASSVDARSVIIKGLAANHHGVRPARRSADVDLLVDPARFADCVRAFESAGWSVVGGLRPESPRIGDGVTLRNELWPQPVDLHRRFTGFAASPDVVFEAIWAERSEIGVARQSLVVTGLGATILVQALHALRDPHLAYALEYDAVVSRLEGLPPEAQRRVQQLAQATGSGSSAADLFTDAGLVPPPDGHGADHARARAYRLRASRGRNFTADYLDALRHRPVWTWPWWVVRFLFADEETLRRLYGDRMPTGRGSLWRARWWRIRDGVRLLPEAVRILRRVR